MKRATSPVVEPSNAWRRGLSLLLQDLVEHLCAGVLALDGAGEVVHLSDSLRNHFADPVDRADAGRAEEEPLPIELLERIRHGVLGIAPGETRVFRLSWTRRRHARPKEYSAVACAAYEATSAGERLILVALQAKVAPVRTPGHAARRIGTSHAEEAISLESLVAECWADLSASGVRGAIELDLQLEPDLPPLQGRRLLWQEMLRDACRSAVETMPTGGTLSIRARVLKAGPGPEAIRLLVRDTGRGHDAEAIRRVLSCEPDEAAGEAERRLIATRRVAEALGGTLHLVSARARGTSVVIDLPVAGGTSGPAGRRGAERGAIYDFPRGWA